MAIAVLQHVHHRGRHLGFFKTFIFNKTAANFLEISRKHVFTTVFNFTRPLDFSSGENCGSAAVNHTLYGASTKLLLYSGHRPQQIHFFFNKNKLNKNTEAEIAKKNTNKLRTD